MSYKEHLDIITCPCTQKSQLNERDGKLQCAREDCYHNKEQNWFKLVSGKPVLISEKTCDTVCDSNQTESVIDRSKDSRLRYVFKSFLFGISSVTRENCQGFIGLLQKETGSARVLVVGSDEKGSGTEELYASKNVSIVGTDIYASHNVQFISDAHYLPFKIESLYFL